MIGLRSREYPPLIIILLSFTLLASTFLTGFIYKFIAAVITLVLTLFIPGYLILSFIELELDNLELTFYSIPVSILFIIVYGLAYQFLVWTSKIPLANPYVTIVYLSVLLLLAIVSDKRNRFIYMGEKTKDRLRSPSVRVAFVLPILVIIMHQDLLSHMVWISCQLLPFRW